MKIRTIALLVIAFLSKNVLASNFDLIKDDTAAKLYYTGNELVVKTAIDLLIDDSKLICKHPFEQVNQVGNHTVVIGIPDREPAFRVLLEQNKIDYKDVTGKWEAYKIITAADQLFVIGSDPRGTAYGVLELSRQMGVTPWVWWADVTPGKKAVVTITTDGEIHAPSVQYRGIFLNDEDWALMPWSTRTFEPTPRSGAIGPKTYARIFELLLRLRANTIWPAMHECTIPFFFVEGNKEAAEKYGIVVSNSHAEPMMRTNTGEWNSRERGAFNFLSNEKQVLSYWDERSKELAGGENIYTIGMRGIHDGRMQGVNSLDDETKVLHRIIDEQRKILARNNPGKNVEDIPQQFVPYKEVLKAYDNGLTLPDDVSLVWCDDNHGYIMRLSNPEEQKRSGGGGVYYHISYWGKPHDYLWLASTQPGLIYTEMKRAWDYNARRIWILNVGDIKPHEYLTEFFMDMAWDIDAFAGDKIYAHRQNWVNKVFGDIANKEINHILRQYYHLASQRKPEHTAWNQVEDWELRKMNPKNRYGLQPVKDSELSFSEFGDETERRLKGYNEIAELSMQVYEKQIPAHLKAAYFLLVHYPVLASASINKKHIYAQKARFYAESNPEAARTYSSLATAAYNEIAALDYHYNKDMLNGKWDLMMDMKPRDLPVFQAPVLPELSAGNCTPLKALPIEAKPFSFPANRYQESDRMIALNAADYTNNIALETIESLGHSGNAVRLPVAKKINAKQPHLEYKVTTSSNGIAKIKLGTIPMHPANGKAMRCAIVIDKQKPVEVTINAEFLSKKWAENVLRNQALNTVNVQFDKSGEHIIRIYSLDEEVLIDQLMIDFNLERKHYLIPVPFGDCSTSSMT